MRLIPSLFLSLAIMPASAVLAESANLDSLPCGSQAITLGMNPQQIKATCGQNWKPAYISKHKRPAAGSNGSAKDHFEKWMYYMAGSKKAAHVIIKNGEVVRIFTVR